MEALLELAVHAPSLVERDRARAAWVRSADHGAIQAAIALLDSPSRPVRRRVTRLLAALGTARALPAILRTFSSGDSPPRVRRDLARWLQPRLLASDEGAQADPQRSRAIEAMCDAHRAALITGDAALLTATAGPWLAWDDLLASVTPERPASAQHRLAHAAWLRWQTTPDDARETTRAAIAQALQPWTSTLAPERWPNALWLLHDAIERQHPADSRRPLSPTQRRPSARPPFGLGDDTERPTADLAGVLALYQPRLDVNLGVAVRSAEALGIGEVWLVGEASLLSTVARGTDTVLAIHHLTNGGALVARAAREGRSIVAVQQAPSAVSFAHAPYPARPVFLLGAEDDGLPAALLERAALTVEIPLLGAVDSLNVATAATTVLAHWRHVALPAG